MDKLKYKARAKINLGLDVKGRMSNGYHEVKMIMQTVDIYDELEIKKGKNPDIILSVESHDELGNISNNLIFRAAKLMKEYYGIKDGIEIHLRKRIPVAAGMAGGSTDAAVTMLAMDEMFGLECGREKLMELALRLGADIPYCIMGGTALAQGIGEKLTPLPKPPEASLLVVKPPLMVSTKWVYDTLDAGITKNHPDIDGMVEAIKRGDLDGIASRMGNVLENVTGHKYGIISDIKNLMIEKGALNALMSGSGPSVFGIYRQKQEAENAAEYIKQAMKDKKMHAEIFVTRFYNE